MYPNLSRQKLSTWIQALEWQYSSIALETISYYSPPSMHVQKSIGPSHKCAHTQTTLLDTDAPMIFVVAEPTKQHNLLLHKGSRLYSFSVQQLDTSPAKHRDECHCLKGLLVLTVYQHSYHQNGQNLGSTPCLDKALLQIK
jgi:hypothetical protein